MWLLYVHNLHALKGPWIISFMCSVIDVFLKVFSLTFVDGKNKIVEILDTSGSQEFPAMREMYIQQGDHFVVVYSVDSQKSFITAQNICNEIRAIKGTFFPIQKMFCCF